MTQPPEKSSVDNEVFKTFERMVSRQRLQRYRRATGSKAEAIALYLWNIALCEALYPTFQFLEVSLRNASNVKITEHYSHNTRWFMDYAILTEPWHQSQVQAALDSLHRRGKLIGRETDPDYPKEPFRVVAELSLAFWVNLYSNPYASTIVTAVVAEVFPNGPKEIVKGKRQDVIYPRLREILDIRNRVSHHEPIYHWASFPGDKNLKQYYHRLIELLGWMCPVQSPILAAVDRFNEVYDDGPAAYQSAITEILQNEQKANNPA
jgi:hypothetical protein